MSGNGGARLARATCARQLFFVLGTLACLASATTATAIETVAAWTFELSPPWWTVDTSLSFYADEGAGSLFGYHANWSEWSSPSGNGSPTSAAVDNWSPGDFWEISVSTLGHADLAFSWDQTQSATSPPIDFTLQYSIDGLVYDDLQVYTIPSVSWAPNIESSYSRFSANLTSVPEINDQSQVFLRLIYTPGTDVLAPADVVRIDNLWLTSGVSNGGFEHIVNLPADGSIPAFDVIGPNTQVNVHGGAWDPLLGNYNYGFIDSWVTAGDGGEPANIEVNVYGATEFEQFGGEVNSYFRMFDGVTLNVHGGLVGDHLEVHDGASLHVFAGGIVRSQPQLYEGSRAIIVGGSVGGDHAYFGANGMVTYFNPGLQAYGGSTLEISGGALVGETYIEQGANVLVRGAEFRLNGELIDSLETGGVGASEIVQLGPGDILSAVLSDGTPLSLYGNSVEAELTLLVEPVPAALPGVISVDDYGVALPRSVRNGQTLVVTTTWAGLYSFADDPPLVVGYGGTAQLDAGNFDSIGGVVAQGGSEVVISGANVSSLHAEAGSIVGVFGGDVENLFVREGSEVSVWGGTVRSFEASQPGGSLTLRGGNFRIDGTLISLLEEPSNSQMIDLNPGQVLTGELSDGRPLMLFGGYNLADGVLTLVADVPEAPTETVINVTTPIELDHAREGQTFNVLPGGELPSRFTAGYGSRLNFNGGTSGYGIDALGGSEVVISSGNVATTVFANAQSHVSVEGGRLSYVEVKPGADFSISGGELSSGFNEGRIEITGGDVARIYTFNAGTVEVSGGSVDLLQLAAGTTATLVGTSFQIDGVDVTSLLSPTTPYVVTQRNVMVEGILADGSPIGDFVSPFYTDANWFAATGATLQLLLAADKPLLVGDYNNDGIVDLTDYVVWRNKLGTTDPLENDPIGGMIGTDHYLQWKQHFGESATAAITAARVPEPAMIVPALLLAAAASRRRWG